MYYFVDILRRIAYKLHITPRPLPSIGYIWTCPLDLFRSVGTMQVRSPSIAISTHSMQWLQRSVLVPASTCDPGVPTSSPCQNIRHALVCRSTTPYLRITRRRHTHRLGRLYHLQGSWNCLNLRFLLNNDHHLLPICT